MESCLDYCMESCSAWKVVLHGKLFQHQKKDKGKTFSVNRRVHTPLWFRNMDINQDLAETAGWMLHPDAENDI